MSDHGPIAQPREVAAWLAEGPDRAPAGLLRTTMARVASTPQRPSILAFALGARNIGAGANRPMSLRLWLVGVMLVLTAIVAIVVAGSLRQQPIITTVIPPSPPPSVLDHSPIPSEPVPSEQPAFDAGQNVFVAWSAVNPWTQARAIPGGNPMFMAEHLREVVFDSCINLCTGRFVIDVIVGTIDEGLVYGWQSCPILGGGLECASYQAEHPRGITLAVEGTTTDELAAAWQVVFGQAQREQTSVVGVERWQILTYEDHSVAIVAKGSRVVAVTIRAQGGLPVAAVPVMLARFLPAIQFGLDPNPGLLPPVSATLGDITVTMPSNFAIGTGPRTLFLSEDTRSFLVTDDRVTRLLSGGTVRVERAGGSTPATFEVRGATLEEVRSSIDAGVGSAMRSDLRIGDALGYRWRVPQQSIIHPLVAVAVIEWKGSFYVFEEHLPLEGGGGGNFDLVLQGVTLR